MELHKDKNGRITRLTFRGELEIGTRIELRLPDGHYGMFKSIGRENGKTIFVRKGTRKDILTLMDNIGL